MEATHVAKSFLGREVLADISLSVQSGTIYALIGRNGAGKTTLLEILVGIQRRFLGSVAVAGCDVRGDVETLHERVAYVPTHLSHYKWMSVKNVINFASRMHRRWNDQLCDRLVKQFDLPLAAKLGTLSHGTSIKVALLLALSFEPRVLIIDEATSNLDIVARNELLSFLRMSATETGVTVLISSHIITDVENFADEIGVIRDGRLVCSDKIDNLRRRVKRLKASTCEAGLKLTAPPCTLICNIRDAECQIIVSEFSEGLVSVVREHGWVVEVEDLTLEQIVRSYLGDLTVVDWLQ